MSPVLLSTIACPLCGHRQAETMPTDACQYFYDCRGCGQVLRPKPGDCCVFCSYGDVPCPPVQEHGRACCGPAEDAAVPAYCSLDRDAFAERRAEIRALLVRFAGRAEPTADGVALVFADQSGLRPALEALAAQERQCCATMEFAVVRQGAMIELRIAAGDAERAALQTCFE